MNFTCHDGQPLFLYKENDNPEMGRAAILVFEELAEMLTKHAIESAASGFDPAVETKATIYVLPPGDHPQQVQVAYDRRTDPGHVTGVIVSADKQKPVLDGKGHEMTFGYLVPDC